MENISEMAEQIRKLHKENEDFTKKVELCFDLMEAYSRIDRRHLPKNEGKDCCYAAIILSGIVQKRLGNRVAQFLKEYGQKLPQRAVNILSGNIFRMNGY